MSLSNSDPALKKFLHAFIVPVSACVGRKSLHRTAGRFGRFARSLGQLAGSIEYRSPGPDALRQLAE